MEDLPPPYKIRREVTDTVEDPKVLAKRIKDTDRLIVAVAELIKGVREIEREGLDSPAPMLETMWDLNDRYGKVLHTFIGTVRGLVDHELVVAHLRRVK
jgi:hypothetical protein